MYKQPASVGTGLNVWQQKVKIMNHCSSEGISLQLDNPNIIHTVNTSDLCCGFIKISASTSMGEQQGLKSSYWSVWAHKLTECNMSGGNMANTCSVTEVMFKLTRHDPLTDELLSCASLLKLELEDCMETETTEDRRKESVSLLQPPFTHRHTQHLMNMYSFTPTWRGPALSWKIHPLISFSSFCYKSNRRRYKVGVNWLLHTSCSGFTLHVPREESMNVCRKDKLHHQRFRDKN